MKLTHQPSLTKFLFLLCVTGQVLCDTKSHSSYIKIFKLCNLVQFSQETTAQTESDCACMCLARHDSGGCEAYQWNAATETCFMQDTLNITTTEDSSRTYVGVMLPKDLAKTTACPEGYYTYPPCNVAASCVPLTLTLPSPYVGMGGSLTVTVA